MFNLEQSIADWRRQMLATGIKTPAPLDELESHLREDIGALVSAGEPEELWNWNPREIGGLCASGWFIAVWLGQRFGRASECTTMFLSTAGIVTVSLTWFGSIFIVTESFWPLGVFVSINLVFILFVIGMTNETEATES